MSENADFDVRRPTLQQRNAAMKARGHRNMIMIGFIGTTLCAVTAFTAYSAWSATPALRQPSPMYREKGGPRFSQLSSVPQSRPKGGGDSET